MRNKIDTNIDWQDTLDFLKVLGEIQGKERGKRDKKKNKFIGAQLLLHHADTFDHREKDGVTLPTPLSKAVFDH
jgi:hypothetical protein